MSTNIFIRIPAPRRCAPQPGARVTVLENNIAPRCDAAYMHDFQDMEPRFRYDVTPAVP
jgi:hypothetical protein